MKEFLKILQNFFDWLFGKEQKIDNIEKFKQEVQKYKNFIVKKDYVTTYSEGQFFRRLQEFIKDKNVLIFTKVRIGDIIEVKKFSNGHRKISISSRLDRSHVDFVCVRKTDLKIICAIELDDPTHNTKIAQERDEVKDFIFQFVGIPLIRFNTISPTDDDFRGKGL